MRLKKSLNAWGTPDFKAVLKQEFEQLNGCELPLQQGLTVSSHVTDRPIQAMVLSVVEEAARIRVKLGVFYTGVIAGCNCAEDPSPIDEQNEYCVIQLDIDKATAESTASLLPD